MKELILPTTLTLPTKLPRVRSLTTVEAVPTLPRLPSYNKEAVANAQYQKQLQEEQAAQQAALVNKKDYKGYVGLMNPNDPYSLNSMADWFLNRKAKEKRYGGFAKFLHKIPVLGDAITGVVASFDMGVGHQWASIFKGDFKALGINMLTNFSETMDILANPVKSLIVPLVNKDTDDPRYKLPWYKRLRASVGFGKEGRYNYNYDTGFWLSDFGLEVISDPLNLIAIAKAPFSIGAKKATSAGIKQTTKATAKEIADAAKKAGVKVISKKGVALSAEQAQKIVSAKAAKALVTKSLNLKLKAAKISAISKKLAKQARNTAIKNLAQDLDVALTKTNGIVDDTAKSIVNSIAEEIKALAKSNDTLSKKALNALSELTKETDEFIKTSNYKLKDLLEASGISFRLSDADNIILTSAGKKQGKLIKSKLRTVSELTEQKELTEALEALFSNPAYVKKYRHISFQGDDLDTIFSSIDLTDYLNAANSYLQNARSFKLMSALDKLSKGTQAIDRTILKASFLSGPVGQAIFAFGKSKGWAAVKKHTTRWLLKRLTDIQTFFIEQSHRGTSVLLNYGDMQVVFDRTLKEFTILSQYDFTDSGFDKELAKYVYDDTLMWLKGQAHKERYIPDMVANASGDLEPVYKAKNLLIADESELEKQIFECFEADWKRLGITDRKQAVNYFFEQHRLRGAQFRNPAFSDWDVTDYIAALKIDEIQTAFQRNFASFNDALDQTERGLNRKGGLLKYLNDIDLPSKGKLPSVSTHATELLAELDEYAKIGNGSLVVAVNKEFQSLVPQSKTTIRDKISTFSSALVNLQTTSKKVAELGVIVKTRTGQKAAPELIAQALLDLEEAVQSMKYSANQAFVAYKTFKKNLSVKNTAFVDTKIYQQLRQISSPYYGYSTHYATASQVRYEIQTNVYLKNLEILKNKDFQELINSLRVGGYNKQLLDQTRLEALEKLKEYNKTLDSTKKFSHDIQMQQDIINNIETIENTINSIDAYVDHISLLKQSTVPEEIQNTYLEVLQEYNIRDAVSFKTNFEQHTSEIIKRINERLANNSATHNYTLNYYAAKFLNDENMAAFSEKFLNSQHTALDQAEFIEALFKNQLLPELQKTKDIVDAAGNITGTQYVHSSYLRHQHRKYVYINLQTTGANGTLDSVSDFGINCPDANLKWQYAVPNETDEPKALLEIYKKLKALKEENKELTFITGSSHDSDARFLQSRYLEAMETINLSGDQKLLQEYKILSYKPDKTDADKELMAKLFKEFQETIPEDQKELFAELAEAQHWMHQNYTSSSLNIIDLMKKFEGVPTLGEYSWDIRRFLFAHVNRQATNNGHITLSLTDDFLDRIRMVPTFSIENYGAASDSLYKLFKSVQDWDSHLTAKGNSYGLSGRYLMDDSFYKTEVYSSANDAEKIISSNEVTVYDKNELLDLRDDGRWYFNNSALPEDITDANKAVRYLRKQNIEYAPKWKALSIQQQFASYPVMINGKVCIVPIEGPNYFTVKKFIDVDLVRDFFLWSSRTDPAKSRVILHSYKAQHALTAMAQQMSDVIKAIKNPRAITEVAEDIDRVFQELYDYVTKNAFLPGLYKYLRSDLDIYHKYAVLVVALKDESSEAPRRLLKRSLERKVVSPKIYTVEDFEALGFPKEVQRTMLSLEENQKRHPYARGMQPFTKWVKEHPADIEPFKPLELDRASFDNYVEPDFTNSSSVNPVIREYNKRVLEIAEKYKHSAYDPERMSWTDYQAEVSKLNTRRKSAMSKARKDLGIVEDNEVLWKEYLDYEGLRTIEYERTTGAYKKARADFRRKNAELKEAYYKKKNELESAAYKEYAEAYLKQYDADYATKYKKHLEFVEQKTKLEKEALEEADRLNTEVYAVENAKRLRAAKILRSPKFYANKESKFQSMFREYSAAQNLNYTDNKILQSRYSEHVLNFERYTSLEHARNLKQALEEANADLLQTTKALKGSLDKHRVYTPSLQRHAVLGASQVDLNDYKMALVSKYQSEPEFDTFMSCDKQIVNNLEDLTLLQVLSLNMEDLRSFVYHQGKGCVIIPVAAYLKDSAVHSIDIKTPLSGFLKKYLNKADEYITIKRVKDDLIIYANDYLFHMKQNIIPYKRLKPIDINDAFKAAFGYPEQAKRFSDAASSTQAYFAERLKELNAAYPNKADPRYIQGYNNLLHNTTLETNKVSKQTAFLYTHWDDIEGLRKKYIAQQQSLERLAVDYEHEYNQYLGGFGRIITQDELNNIHETLPKAIRQELYGTAPLDKTTVIKFYTSQNSGVFNFSTLGRAEYRHHLEPFATSDYHKIMADTYRNLSSSLSTLSQYAKFFDSSSPLSLKNFMPYATPEELFIALKQTDDYTISYFGVDKKGLPRLVDIPINSVEDIKFALDKGAAVIPNITHASITQTVNAKRWSTDSFISQIFHKVTYFNKMFTLIPNMLGFVFRNTVDSTLKNAIVSKDFTLLDDYASAFKYLNDYEDTVARLFQLSPENPFKPSLMREVFENKAVVMDEETFMLIHNFLESGPSAGSINSVAAFYLEKAAKKPNVVQKFFDWTMNPTKQVEQVTRLALYLNSIKKGLTNTDAFKIIAKTHFDYATKTTSARLIELIIPFFTFQTKNFMFWLDILQKNPVLTACFVDMFTTQWNWEDMDFDRIQYYQSQLNHMLQSNIQLNQQGLTLKLNPSYMDPVSLVLNPVDSLAGRTSPIVKPIVDELLDNDPYNYEYGAASTLGASLAATGLSGIAPLGAAIGLSSMKAQSYKSGYRSYQRTGSVLPLIAPSMFGSVRTPAQYGRASYTNSRAFRDPQKRQPRRVNIYNKLYTDTGKNRWQLRYLPVDNFTIQWRIRESTNRFR